MEYYLSILAIADKISLTKLDKDITVAKLVFLTMCVHNNEDFFDLVCNYVSCINLGHYIYDIRLIQYEYNKNIIGGLIC